MPTFQQLERAFVNAHEAGDRQAAAALAAELRNYSRAAEPRKEEPKKAPESRNVFRVASDTAIAVANSFAGGIEAAADFVAPGNSFSKAIDKFTKTTESLQSDMVKAGREKFQKDLEAAKTGGEEVAAVARYIAENPLQATGQAIGSFLGPGVAIKGSVKAAQLLNLTEKAASRVGLGAGVVTNAMMAGGDAGGSAYKMVMDTPDKILLQNDYIRSQVEKGISLEKLKEEAATTAARRASFVPALIGGATGAFGVERFLAGVGGKTAATTLGGAIKAGLSEAAQEAIEEGVTEYSGRAAAQTYDPRIDPTKGVAGAAAMGAALGFIPGAGIGALETRNALAAEAAKKDLEAQQALAKAQESAAAIVPDAQAVKAQAEQAAKPPTTLPFGIATPEQVAAAINPEAAAAPEADPLAAVDAQMDAARAQQQVAQDKLPPVKVKNETAEQKVIRYDAELALGVEIKDGELVPLTPTRINQKTKALKKAEEELGVENVTIIRANAAQSSGINAGGDQSRAQGAASKLGQPSGEAGAPIDTRLDDSGRDAKQSDVAATDQQPTLSYEDGSIYTGEVVDGFPQGQGTFTWPDGDSYVGNFENGIQNGQGTYTFANGDRYVGEYKDGKYHGQGTFTFADGRVVSGIFENGVLITEKPSVTQASETIETKKEGPKKEPTPAVDTRKVPTRRTIKLEEEKAAPVAEGFTEAQRPFVQSKVDTREAPPKNIDEAISHAGAETAFDEFDAALDNLNAAYADQIKTENAANQAKFKENEKLGIPNPNNEPTKVTVYDILARMTQSERQAAIDKAIDENKLKPRQAKKKQVRDAFVKSLSKKQQEAVEAKRKETIEAEVKAVSKLGKKSASDIRTARKKASTAGTSVATAKVGKAQPVTTQKVKEKKVSDNIIDRPTVEALRSGNTETILRAIKTGYTDPATKLFASRIEAVLSQFGMKPTIVIGKVEGNRPAQYDPANETITVDPDAPRSTMLDAVVLHEYAHFITDRAVDNPSSLTPIQKIALDNLSKLQQHVAKKLGKKYEIGTLKEFLAQSFSNSEFVADMAKVPPLTAVIKVPNALREFATRVMQLLGIKGDSASSQVLENIQTMITGPFDVKAPISPKIPGIAKGVSFMEAPKETKQPKQAGEYTGKSTEEFIAGQKLPEKPKGFFGSIMSWFTGGLGNRFKEFTRQYQNEQYPVKDRQRMIERSGLLNLTEKGFNAIWDAVSLAAGNFRNLDNTYVNPIINKINDMLVNMVQETGQSVDTVLMRLSAYGQIMHESEVRAVKYIKNVPLRTISAKEMPISGVNDINWFGKIVTPATARQNILAELTAKDALAKRAESLGMTTKELSQAYRKLLDDIVADKNNLDPSEAHRHDVNSYHYDVLAGLTPEDVKRHLAAFDQNKAERKMMDSILAELRALSDVTIMLNKQANYWSPQVDNLVDFYGYKNYVTYKGKPAREEDADLFYGGDHMLGKEYQKKEFSQEGRYTMPDNSILIMMADASIAASRSGRKDVTKALFNLVDTGLVAGKIEEIVSFEQRDKLKENDKLLQLMNKQNVFLHYMPDGELAIISVQDERLRNAIRKSYKLDNGIIDKLNSLTSFIGQTHTRFNVAFAPKNFIRDVLANAFNISVDMTPGAAANYIGHIANYVMSNGFVKSYNVAAAFYEGGADPAKNPKIKALLAKDKSGHVKDLIDYLQNGGDIAYVSSFSDKGQFRDILKKANRPTGAAGVALTGVDEVVDFFDKYMAGFEFTSRAAAFKMRKAELLGEFAKKGMSKAEAELAANKAAAAFAKGLANFEEKGLKGKQMGAWFMYFNSSATGAVRVIEPLAPALSAAFESIKAGVTLKSPFQGYQAAADRAWAEMPKELREKGNREEFTKKFIEQAKRGKNASAAIFGFGVAMYYLAYAGAGEDEYGRNRIATDDMSRWMRDARFFVGDGINDVITLPWGFGMGAFAAFGAQIASLGLSDTKFSDVVSNSIPIFMDSFLPLPVSKGSFVESPGKFIIDSVAPAPLRPVVEFAMNYNSLGQEIYDNRQGPNGSVYTGGDNVPKMFFDASAFLYESSGFEFGPNEMYFYASAYMDALAKAGSAGWNLWYLALGGEDNRTAMERWKQDSLVLSSFIGTRSDYDARMWSKIEKDLEKRRDRLNELEDANIEAYYDHLAENPLDEFLVKQFNKDANGELKKLRGEAKAIRRSSEYDFATKRELLAQNRTMASLLKMQLVDLYTSMGYEF